MRLGLDVIDILHRHGQSDVDDLGREQSAQKSVLKKRKFIKTEYLDKRISLRRTKVGRNEDAVLGKAHGDGVEDEAGKMMICATPTSLPVSGSWARIARTATDRNTGHILARPHTYNQSKHHCQFSWIR